MSRNRKAYIICQKCGSDEMYFKIDENPIQWEGEPYNCGVDLCCTNCGELTSIEEWNEYNPVEERYYK